MSTAQKIEFSSNGRRSEGYLAHPEGEGAFPAIVAIQEWWGVVPHMLEVAERFAQEGFICLIPDLYDGQSSEEPNEARKLAMALDRERAIQQIEAAISHLQAQEDVAPKKIGVVGWCMGGGLALSTSAASNQIGATVCFYGRPLEAQDTPKISSPVLGLYGELDGGIPVSMVQDFEKELQRHQVEHKIHIYAGAEHAFFNDSRPQAFHAEAAADAWQKTVAWFGKHLV